MIFISTGGRRNVSAAESALDFYNNGISGVELSGGAYVPDYAKELMALPGDLSLQVHNYFPPPKTPFVFNLASNVPSILKKSMDHAKNAMQLAQSLGRPIYSFHAGFRINPSVEQLGKKLSGSNLLGESEALAIFGECILDLAEVARREGVTLLIENNVLTKETFNNFEENPLLLSDPQAIVEFMKAMPPNVRILLDVAHLKVSGKTLNFDLIEAHNEIKPWIKGYHLSDNDGRTDSNGKISDDSWFWACMVRNLDYYSLEVYGETTSVLSDQFRYLQSQLNQQPKFG